MQRKILMKDAAFDVFETDTDRSLQMR